MADVKADKKGFYHYDSYTYKVGTGITYYPNRWDQLGLIESATVLQVRERLCGDHALLIRKEGNSDLWIYCHSVLTFENTTPRKRCVSKKEQNAD